MMLTPEKFLERSWKGITQPALAAKGVAMAHTWLSDRHPGHVHYEVVSITQQQGWNSKRPIDPVYIGDALQLLLQPLGFSLDDVRWRPDGTKPHDNERRERRLAEQDHFVYFVTAGPFLKIGKTSGAPDSRIKELQTGCPFPMQLVAHLPGGLRKERELHRKFDEYRAHGEWFRHEGRLAAFVQSLVEVAQ